ncbi:MAG TPA: serine hydrolase domain-containing protein, partial [Paludibacteraceae bacterium]|nr:serine hydrolase domain-containing protein [Paludibacteraceae bacterium]
MNRLLHTITLSLFCLIAAELTVQASPKTVKTEVQRLSCIDTIVNSAIAQQTIPGAVVAVVRGDKTVYIKAFGNKQIYPDTVPMTIDAVFDLASVSKAVATTTCAMLLIEKGLIRLEDRVDKFLPNFRNYTDANETQPIRVVDLLTHTSGLPSYVGIAT